MGVILGKRMLSWGKGRYLAEKGVIPEKRAVSCGKVRYPGEKGVIHVIICCHVVKGRYPYGGVPPFQNAHCAGEIMVNF